MSALPHLRRKRPQCAKGRIGIGAHQKEMDGWDDCEVLQIWFFSLSQSPAGVSGETLKDTGPHLARKAVPGFCLEIVPLFYLWALLEAGQCFPEARRRGNLQDPIRRYFLMPTLYLARYSFTRQWKWRARRPSNHKALCLHESWAPLKQYAFIKP